MHNLSLFLAGYDDLLLNEVVQLRSKYQTLKKAKAHSNEVLPAEPGSLVEKYLIGKERPLKEQVVASQNTRYTKPALSSENMENTHRFRDVMFMQGHNVQQEDVPVKRKN